MSTLDYKVTSGDTVVFDADYHNDLVAELEALQQDAEIKLQASTEQPVVSPHVSADGDSTNDYPLEPSSVRVADATTWGLPASEAIRISWTLEEGPGHISASPGGAFNSSVSTSPGSAIYWSWARGSTSSYYDNRPDRDWEATLNSQTLPLAVVIQAEAESLTLETNGSPVDTSGDLSGISSPTDGERRLVRDESAIYEYDAGTSSWSSVASVTASDYALIDKTRQSLVVERGYDPQAQPGIVPSLHAHRDVAYLDSNGVAEIDFDDFTTTGGLLGVDRTVSASIRNIGSGPTSVDADLQGIGTAGDASFTVTTEATGLLVVTATYDSGGQTAETTTAVRIRPSLEPALGTTTDPALPPVKTASGDGTVQMQIGQQHTIQNLVDQGPVVSGESPDTWNASGTRELARRLGLDELLDTDPRMEMLHEAGALLVAALSESGSRGLREYDFRLPEGAATVGQVVFLGPGRPAPAGALRITKRRDGPGLFTAVGVVDDASVSDAYVTGNGDRFPVDVELAYGTQSDNEFPQETLHHTIDAAPGVFKNEIHLPRRQPTGKSDRWYVRYRPAAQWNDGELIRGQWSDWTEAEATPSGPASASLEADGGLTLTVDAESPVGSYNWTEPGADQIDPDTLLPGGPVPSAVPARPDPKLWTDPSRPPRLKVALVQTASAGSARGQVEQFDLSVPSGHREALPKTTTESNAIPSDWPVVSGMLVEGDTKHWMGIGEQWVPFGGGGASLVDDVTYVASGGSTQDAAYVSPVEYDIAFQAFGEDSLEVRLHASGSVDSVQLMDANLSLLQPGASPQFVEEGGYFRQQFQVPSDAYGTGDTLLYRLKSGSDYELATLNVDNTSIDSSTAPSILSANAIPSGGADYTVTPDSTTTPDQWTLQLDTSSSEDWQDAFVTLACANLGVAETASSSPQVDLAGTRFNVDTDSEPQMVYLNLRDEAFKSGNNASVSVTLTLKRSSESSAPQKNVKLIFNNPNA
jgi:hypothetical protein